MSDAAPHPPVVMGIDPGVSTGVALAHYTQGGWQYHTSTHKEVHTIWELIQFPVKVLIVENFSAQLISKYGIHTVEVVGGVIALAWKHNIQVIRDTPQQRRPYLEYARAQVPLRDAHTQYDLRHEVDALSHVIRYLYREQYLKSLVWEM